MPSVESLRRDPRSVRGDGAAGAPAPGSPGGDGVAGGFARRVEDAVARVPAAVAAAWRAVPAPADDQPELRALVDRLAGQGGGKYVRARLAAAAYLGSGGSDVRTCDALATAVQLLHVGLCVHDDLIDDDDRRHGAANVFGRVRDEWLERGADRRVAGRQAASAALLAGDLAIGEAMGLLAAAPVAPEVRVALVCEAVAALRRAVSGELMDVAGEESPPEAARPTRTAELKTSGYSVVLPLRAGALASGRADAATLDALDGYGRHLGVAYQLRDDELAVFGDPERTGKSTSSDIRGGKRTFLLQLTLAAASPAQRASLERDVGRPGLTEDGIERVRAIMRETGALERHRACIVRRAADAAAALDDAGLPAALDGYLRVLARSVPTRES
ncbi:polyprenyl synthetase family protein [Agromyces tropicus]|uniref:Polyprenyl synthetase family protein n=1 Tax=Agromyces tropicus TaxID=555371 RepID=A0ABN2UJD0_9MICO